MCNSCFFYGISRVAGEETNLLVRCHATNHCICHKCILLKMSAWILYIYLHVLLFMIDAVVYKITVYIVSLNSCFVFLSR